MPAEKPTAAGTNANFPYPADISIAGRRSDHTEAATITPDAKPSSIFSTCLFSAFLIKRTQAAPAKVPRNGIMSPTKISISITIPFLQTVNH